MRKNRVIGSSGDRAKFEDYADLYNYIWDQLEELDGQGDPDDEFVESLLVLPEGVDQERFDAVLAQVEADRDSDPDASFLKPAFGVQ